MTQQPTTRTPRRQSRSRRAFSFVEMLVVVAIITTVLAILLPAMIKVRAYSNLVICQVNMHNIGISFLSYTVDNKKFVPGPNWRKGRSRGWLYSDLKMDKLADLETGQLWPYLDVYEIFRCPSDNTPQQDPASIPNRPNNSRMITSYCMNGSVIRYGGKPYNNPTTNDPLRMGYWGYWETYRITQFSSTDVLYWEPDETKAGGWWWDGANFPWEGVTERHFDHASVSCVDGSVEWMRLDLFYAQVYRNWPVGWKVGDPWPGGLQQPHSIPTRLWNTPGTRQGLR